MLNLVRFAILFIHSACGIRETVNLVETSKSNASQGANFSHDAVVESGLIAGTHLQHGTMIDSRYKLLAMLWPSSLKEYSNPEELGRGAFGAAFSATDTETGNTVVVKLFFKEGSTMLLTKYNANQADQVRLFLAKRECLAAQYVQRAMDYSPGRARWMKCLKNGVDSSRAAYVVYEYLGPTTIRQYGEKVLEGDPDYAALDPDDMKRIAKQLLEGLALVQGQYVHRDIKAENVMIYESSGLKNIWYIDVGLVTEVGDRKALTAGTPMTMAPESWVPGYIPKSSFDVYSVGAMLYELFCGEYLYDYMSAHIKAMNPMMASNPGLIDMKLKQDLLRGPNPKAFCDIEGDHSELFNFVVDNMLTIETQRKDAITMLNDPIFADVDTSGGALTAEEPFEALKGEKLPEFEEQQSAPVQLIHAPVRRVIVHSPPVVVRRVVYQRPLVVYRAG